MNSAISVRVSSGSLGVEFPRLDSGSRPLRSDKEPFATGHSFWMAAINHRPTSAVDSFVLICVRVTLLTHTTCHRLQQHAMFFLDFSDRVPSATLPGRSNRFGTFGHRMVSILTVLKRISRPGRLFRA